VTIDPPTADPEKSLSSANAVDGRTLALFGALYGLFFGNLLLYAVYPLPWLVHIGLGTVAIHLAFTVWHEAAHHTIFHRHPWANDVVGVLGIFPYMTPFFIQKYVHLRHHARLNDPEDPNRLYADGSFLSLPLRYPQALRYAKRALAEDPRSGREKAIDIAFLVVLATVWAVAAWQGWLLALIGLWLVPLVIAKLMMDWYINWVPHVGLPADRFRGTRVLDVPWLTPLVLAHNYHAIHHLWPRIPWHGYRAVFREKREYLREHGVPIERRVPGLGVPRDVPIDALSG